MRHPCANRSPECGRSLPQQLLQSLILLLGLVLSCVSFAQTSSQPDSGAAPETWYEVEVVVFARPDGDASEEVWPKNLFLSYPFNWAVLRDPDTTRVNRSDLRTEKSSDATEQDPLALKLEPQTQMVKPDLSRDPMFELPATERRLNGHARAMERRKGYQILFHQAWRQPMVEDQELPALLITGGNEFGEHFELEGSIRLSLSRYLHLNTDLWLTRFEPNYGQELGAWPQLPERPTQSNVEPQNENLSTGELSPLGNGTQSDSASGAWERVLAADQESTLSLKQNEDLPSFLREPFLPNRIATLKQSRRMRSSELHYLDHPLMGLLIIITPYQRPIAETISDLELGN